MSDAPAVARERKDLATVSETIQESGGENGIAHDVGPTIKAFVGSNDDGGIFIEVGDELKEEVCLNFADRQIAEFINDEKMSLLDPLESGGGGAGDS